MAHGAARVVSLLLLLVLAVSVIGPALDPAFELPPQHFDGDADDPGHVGNVFSYWVDVSVTDTLIFVPSAPVRYRPSEDVLPPEQVALEPHGSRAPPG
jgi:hypothetical protein